MKHSKDLDLTEKIGSITCCNGFWQHLVDYSCVLVDYVVFTSIHVFSIVSESHMFDYSYCFIFIPNRIRI